MKFPKSTIKRAFPRSQRSCVNSHFLPSYRHSLSRSYSAHYTKSWQQSHAVSHESVYSTYAKLPRGALFALWGTISATTLFVSLKWSTHRLDSWSENSSPEDEAGREAARAKLGPTDFSYGASSTAHGTFKPPAPLSSAQVDEILYAQATTNLSAQPLGIPRYDAAKVASNSPTEDHHVDTLLAIGSDAQWMSWGVYDGHAGAQVSRVLKDKLTTYVAGELSKVLGWPQSSDAKDPSSIDSAIKRAFIGLDHDIMAPAAAILKNGTTGFAEQAARMMTTYAGSCALLCLWDPKLHMLRVACTGDSRAVLATPTADGSWVASNPSVDQNGESKQELARLQADHPNEPDIVKGKRLLGLAVTRAFGDGRWKLAADVQEYTHTALRSPKSRPHFATPPYLTAEPEITTTELEANRPYFMILASDGLWDHMTSQQAVDLVSKWLAWNARGRPSEDDNGTREKFAPFDYGEADPETESEWQIRPEWCAVQDSNAATHLIRNAFGGRNHEVLSAVIGAQPPYSREVRDDTTVQVVFFGKGWDRRLPEVHE